jgi:ornithine cyclodeaminase
MKGIRIRYISNDIVREVLSIEEALTIIEEVYRDHGEGKASLSNPSSLDLETAGTGTFFKIKGAYISSLYVAGFRLLGMGTSSPLGLCYLCDPNTSLPMAIIDESWQYLVRSGLTAAVVAKYLARPDSKILGLLGCGKIAPYTLFGLKKFFTLHQVRVNSQRRESRVKFSKEMEKTLGIEVIPVDSPQEAVTDADIVVTLTNADRPLVLSNWLRRGAFVCSLGEGQELHPNVLDWADKFVVDDFNFCLVLGDIAAWVKRGLKKEEEVRRRVWSEIGEIVAGKKAGRETKDESILGIIQGMASCDIAIAKYVLDKAIQRGEGIHWDL